MLWKLLKYDFRSMLKQFAFIWPAALAIALINRFTLPFEQNHSNFELGDSNILGVITISVFVGVLFAMFVLSLVFILKRFYQGLLGDEGYLMHTLPVPSWQLVSSKLLCAIFVTVMNTIIAVFAVILLFPISWEWVFDHILWQEIFRGLSKHPETILYLLEMLLVMLASLAMGLTMLYLAMAIGHLFQRRRVLMSVVAFFVIEIGMNVITDFLGDLDFFDHLFAWGDSSHLSFLIMFVLIAIPTAAFFAGTSYILSHRLNLE